MPLAPLDEAFRAVVRDVLREVLPPLLRELMPEQLGERPGNQVGGEARLAALDGELLTVDKVALLLNVSKPTVRRWIKSGMLHACRVGPRQLLRVRRADVERLLKSDRLEARSAPASDLDAEAAKIVACSRSRPRKNERAPGMRSAVSHQAGE